MALRSTKSSMKTMVKKVLIGFIALTIRVVAFYKSARVGSTCSVPLPYQPTLLLDLKIALVIIHSTNIKGSLI